VLKPSCALLLLLLLLRQATMPPVLSIQRGCLALLGLLLTVCSAKLAEWPAASITLHCSLNWRALSACCVRRRVRSLQAATTAVAAWNCASDAAVSRGPDAAPLLVFRIAALPVWALLVPWWGG
jgi:hypothetical protein